MYLDSRYIRDLVNENEQFGVEKWDNNWRKQQYIVAYMRATS